MNATLRRLQIAYLQRHGWSRCGSLGWKKEDRVFTLDSAVEYQMLLNRKPYKPRKRRGKDNN